MSAVIQPQEMLVTTLRVHKAAAESERLAIQLHESVVEWLRRTCRCESLPDPALLDDVQQVYRHAWMRWQIDNDSRQRIRAECLQALLCLRVRRCEAVEIADDAVSE